MTEEKKNVSRRDFLGQTALVGAGLLVASSAHSVGATVKGANERVNVGFISPGNRGKELIRALVTVANAKIIAVCDIYEPNLNKGVALATGAPKTFTDYRKLLESKEVDAVVIASPLHMHHEMLLAALDAGKHVYIEKALAHSVEQCQEMVKAVEAHPKLTVQVGQQSRYSQMVRGAVDRIQSGAIGKVTHFRANYHRNGDWRRAVPTDAFDPRPWGYPDLEHLVNWRMYKRYSQGLMAELGTHHIDVANWIFGAMPTAVTGFGGIDYWKDGRETNDNVNVIYTYPEGRKAIFTAITTNAHYGASMQIMGTEGTIELTWDNGFYYTEKEADELVKTDSVRIITATGATTKLSTPSKAAGKGIQAKTPGKAADKTAGKTDPSYLSVESFIACIRESKQPAADIHVGRDAAVSTLTANRAIEEGSVVKF
ncbi:MAG: Gfo/Idh/MocA family oxidoreductase [Acidobacteria bacterium]|nr:Gfo/Idh/MocA family oxidoreductase [Acidobacteriota bacterium]